MGPGLSCPNEQILNLQELATEAQDMEVTITNHCNISFSVVELKKDWAEFKKNVKFSKSSSKQAMTISKVEPVRITGRLNPEEKRSMPFKYTIRKPLTLKALQEKKYLFPNSDLLGILHDLVKKGAFNF